MKVGAILPHLLQYGGIRRFCEIGNCFVNRGIDYTIFARRGTNCSWFNYHGEIRDWSKIQADYILIGDPPSFRILPRVRGKVYIYVIAGGRFLPMYKTVYGKYPFILNNRIFREYFPKAHLIEGGVNTKFFVPKKSSPPKDNIRVLFYDVNREGKDTRYIKHSLKGIPGIKLVSLHGLNNTALRKAYHNGDFLVAWETRAGLSNMSMEALASGLTVVTNGTNCEPFRDKVIIVKDLRKFFLNPHNRKIRKRGSMEEFSWERVTDQLLKLFRQG